jgi:hypothetical protein
MLKLFGGGRPDHPMADAKELRRILDALPPQDQKALEELAHWHESVGAFEGFKLEQRYQLLTAIDDAAQTRLRKLSREYLAAARPSRFAETQMWTRIHDYWKHAAHAYSLCLEGPAPKGADKVLPLAVARALRGLGQQIKWLHVRYGPMDPASWGALGRVYAFAEQRALTDARVVLSPTMPAGTTPKQEFLAAMMFSASSPDSLLPLEVELAERLIGELAASFALASQPTPDLPYWIDLGQAMAPQRSLKVPPRPGPGLRCFGPGAALAKLQEIMKRTQAAKQVPADVNLGGTYAPEVALDVMDHLATYWSTEPPERQHARHTVKSRITIAHGFAGAMEALGGGGSLDFDKSAAESWVVDNVSAGGFGAIVPQAKSDWLRVGTLLAMQPEGGQNWVVGLVRRVNKLPTQEARVGIQTLSRAPMATRFNIRGLGEQMAVLLPPPGTPTGEVGIALPSGIFTPGVNLEAEFAGRQHVYMPAGVAERGEDYDIVKYREMVREA